MHDWGSVGLAFAQRLPERVERLVLTACVPFVPGYRWHRVARGLAHAAGGRAADGVHHPPRLPARRCPRRSPTAPTTSSTTAPSGRCCKLYRASPPEVLARAGERLGELRCPALSSGPRATPTSARSSASGYADALGGEAELELVDAGHSPWLERPEMIDRVADFVG